MEVRIVRLSSGEEILAKCDELENSIKVKNPAMLVPMQQGQLGMMPWLAYADYTEIEIDKKFVMFTVRPQLELMNQYNENMGNGLVVPEKNIAEPAIAGSNLKLT
tara:strand:+ start:638 stop:952 length:315 start_codon:yes stop_codon:yes gene_type:complete